MDAAVWVRSEGAAASPSPTATPTPTLTPDPYTLHPNPKQVRGEDASDAALAARKGEAGG